jgi:hypothetical protein
MAREARATPGAGGAAEPPCAAEPLYEAVLGWLARLWGEAGYRRPARKRLALLVSGLVASEAARLGKVAAAIHGLGVSAAKEESVAQRLRRLLADERLDPARALPDLARALLPGLLAGVLASHRASAGAGAFHHGRFRPLELVVDESTDADAAHILVVGLAYQGLVLPLAARAWPQNEALPPGAYWGYLGAALWEAYNALPAALRDHVVVLADRAYGIPRMLDLLRSLGWGWVLRAQGQTRVRLPDGSERALRELAPRPGAVWLGGPGAGGDPGGDPGPAGGEPAVFKSAGWRGSRVVAAWAAGEKEPWLLLTSLAASAARLRDYADRWMVERLFLCWKSHGWDIEACGVRDPARLGRLLTGLVLATYWRVALALPAAAAHLADLAARAARRAAAPAQLRLPWDDPDLAPPPAPSRPWAAKFSLFSWGTKVALSAHLKAATPAHRWDFPDWHAPTWSQQCHIAYATPT